MTTPSTPGRVAIVLVNWNGWRDAVECISSVLASDAAQVADLYLVDNASTDGSVEHIQAWCADPRPAAPYRAFEGVRHVGPTPIACRVWKANGQPAPNAADCRLTIVLAGGNLGFAGGNNVGIVAAGLDRYQHFWLLNTDTVIRLDALRRLLDRCADDARVGMVGSTLLYYDEPDRIQAMGGAEVHPRRLVAAHLGIGLGLDAVPGDEKALRKIEARLSYVIGASMLVTSEFIRRVGPMCEDYFLYYEEVDWAMRGSPEFTLAYAPSSFVYHKVGSSSEKATPSFSMRLLYRNRVRFIGRFFPDRKWSGLREMGIDILRHLARGRFTCARMEAEALLLAPLLLRR